MCHVAGERAGSLGLTLMRFFSKGTRSRMTPDPNHVWTERLSRILPGCCDLRGLGSDAPEKMATLWLHFGVCILLHAGGMLAGGADHCGGG